MSQRLECVLQDPASSLNPRRAGATTVTEPMATHGLGENPEDRLETAAQTLAEVQLTREHLWRYPHELSGGQRQRIGIARALCLRPDFVVCDEVTSALDQLVAEGILKLLDRLQEDLDLSYMFITHDLATVRSIADEVVVMRNGLVVEQGGKEEMFRPPHHPYTDLLLSSVPEMDSNWLTTLLEERGVDNIGDAATV